MNKIQTALLEIGIPANLLGFKYLSDALEFAISDDVYIYETTKRLYPDVAKKNNTTPTRVERGIRHSIESAFNRNGISIHKLFGNSINANKGKPTNSEFIATVALSLKEGATA